MNKSKIDLILSPITGKRWAHNLVGVRRGFSFTMSVLEVFMDDRLGVPKNLLKSLPRTYI